MSADPVTLAVISFGVQAVGTYQGIQAQKAANKARIQEYETEKKFNSRYDQIVEDIVKNVGLYRMVKYEYQYWAQLYFKDHKHIAHQHARKIHEEVRKQEELIMSWVHFLDVPKQKCFRFLDNDGNFLVPNEQSSGDIIVFPSWVWHEVLPNKSNEERIVISGNISITYYDDFN